MKARLDYSTIGKQLTVRIGLDDLTPRDKVELFRTLMDDLGITERMHAEPEESAWAQRMVTEQWTKAWEGGK
tara:strand:+ start:358 stop:573 length:216 start_codon:yes stop_codon:yes gene_type:complete